VVWRTDLRRWQEQEIRLKITPWNQRDIGWSDLAGLKTSKFLSNQLDSEIPVGLSVPICRWTHWWAVTE